MNILILTASFGGGHIKAAQSLMQYLGNDFPHFRTRVVDTIKYINPAIHKLINETYLQTLKNAPGIYGRLYDLSERDEAFTDLIKGFSYILSPKIYGLIEESKPDVVICTHTMPLQMLSRLKTKKLLHTPVIGIITDYTSHFFWKLKEIDAYVVGHEFVKRDMVRMGFPRDNIHACGIPVSSDFLVTSDKSKLYLKSLGFKTGIPTLLLMGGSLGFGNMQQIFASLLSLQKKIQIIAVAGSNRKLEEHLKSLAENSKKDTCILGYTNRINELMDVSDVLITKPGGVTISEALIKKLPIILINPLPGQEERNAQFLYSSGAAVKLQSVDDMESVLCGILDNPSEMKKMSEAAEMLAMPKACKDIASIAIGLAPRSHPASANL